MLVFFSFSFLSFPFWESLLLSFHSMLNEQINQNKTLDTDQTGS